MGCDIHMHVQARDSKTKVWAERSGGFDKDSCHDGAVPFDQRNYGIFAFLTGGAVRNYSGIKGLGIEPRGLPSDFAPDDYDSVDDGHPNDSDYHSHSWLTLAELLAFDYDAVMEDRRFTRVTSSGWDGRATCEPGDGKKMPWRDFLGETFMADLEVLKTFGAPEDVRIVFWFDN